MRPHAMSPQDVPHLSVGPAINRSSMVDVASAVASVQIVRAIDFGTCVPCAGGTQLSSSKSSLTLEKNYGQKLSHKHGSFFAACVHSAAGIQQQRYVTAAGSLSRLGGEMRHCGGRR